MATVQPIGSATSASGAKTLGSSNAASTVSSLSNSLNAETFMKLFTTQLANQDPMKPMDSAQFLNQFSQITQVQSSAELTKAMGDFRNTMSMLLHASNATQGEGLLGRQVQYTDTNGNPATGNVGAMMIAPDGSVKLNVSGNLVDLGAISQIN